MLWQNGPRLRLKPGPVACDWGGGSSRPFAGAHVAGYVLALTQQAGDGPDRSRFPDHRSAGLRSDLRFPHESL